MTTLNAQVRELVTKSQNKELRESGKIPAVFYGFKKDSTSLAIDKREFTAVFKAAGETSTITLKTPNGEFNAMIHDIQYDPVRGDITHVDFLSVDMSKPIEVEVPFEFIGESQAVKDGRVLVKAMHEIEVSALPNKIPQHIEIDLSKLVGADDIITLGDLVLPEGANFTDEDMTRVIASTTAQQEEVETAPVIDLEAIEVEKKGKKDEEEPVATE